MGLFRRFKVPPREGDVAELKRLQMEADERLQAALTKREEVLPLVANLHREGRTNHYIERLREAYGIR